MTIYSELDKLINRGGSRVSAAENIMGLDIGRYMAARWISMTSAKNAVVMSMFNFYGGIDDVLGLCGAASLLGGRFGKFSYLKKRKTGKRAVSADSEEDRPSRFSEREWDRICSEVEWYAEADKKNRKAMSNGKTV